VLALPFVGVAHYGCPQALDTTWNRGFSGGTKPCRGCRSRETSSYTLIPMGGWYGSPYRTHENTGAQPRNERARPEHYRPELNNSRKGEVSRVDNRPSNGWHLFRGPVSAGLSVTDDEIVVNTTAVPTLKGRSGFYLLSISLSISLTPSQGRHIAAHPVDGFPGEGCDVRAGRSKRIRSQSPQVRAQRPQVFTPLQV
jgi:hypothetical protein